MALSRLLRLVQFTSFRASRTSEQLTEALRELLGADEENKEVDGGADTAGGRAG
jgi:hypothetical protein